MGWNRTIAGIAALLALTVGAWGQAASAPPVPTARPSADTRQITPYQLPSAVPAQVSPPPLPLRASEPPQPRYATMVPPAADDAASAPAAAPTTPVAASPIDERAQVSAPPRQPAAQQTDPNERIVVSALRPSQDGLYRLGPGDKIRLTVFNETDLSGEFAVDGQGFVRLPLIGQLQAAGLTTFGLESRIADAFLAGGFLVSPRVSIEIINYRPFYIIGEVAKPGEYAYVNAMSAPNAIALAGGYTDRAADSVIWVRHQGESKEHEYPADDSTRIYPGDVIRVSRTTYWSIMTVLAPIISPFSSIAYLLK